MGKKKKTFRKDTFQCNGSSGRHSAGALYHDVRLRGTYGVFEGVFRGDAVDFLNGVGGHVEPWRLAVVNHQHLVVFLIGCQNEQRRMFGEDDTFLSILFHLVPVIGFWSLLFMQHKRTNSDEMAENRHLNCLRENELVSAASVRVVNIAGMEKQHVNTCINVAGKKASAETGLLPFTCLTHRSAYLSVLMVLDLPLLLFSDGKCILSSFRVLKSSFCVFALADCSLLQGVHEKDTRASRR